MSAPTRKRKDRAARKGDPAQFTPPSDATDFSLYRRQDGYAAPTADDRLDAAFEAEAIARGYRLALTCLDCGHPIVAEASLRRHRGPRCAARAAEAVADA